MVQGEIQIASTVFLRRSLRKKIQNSWIIQRRIFTVESDLSKATPVTLL